MTQGEMQTPESALADKNGRILAEILSNHELAKLVYALLLQSVTLCHETQKPLSALRFGRINADNDCFSFQFSFGSATGIESSQKVTLKPDFETYLGAKNAGLVKLIRTNPATIDFLENLVTVLSNFAKHKSRKLVDVQIDRAIISRERIFKAQMSIAAIPGGN